MTTPTPAEMGRIARQTGKSPDEIMEEHESEPVDGFDVAWIGGSAYRVTATDTEASFKVDISTGEVQRHDEYADDSVSEYEALQVATGAHHMHPDLEHSIVTEWAATLRDATNTLGNLKANGGTAAAPASGGGGGGSSGGSDEPEEVFEAGETDDDAIDALESWLSDYSKVKGDLNPEWVDMECGSVSVPGEWDNDHAGQTVDGVKIEQGTPWDHGEYDNDSNTVSDEWKAGGDALREVMTDADEAIYFGADYGYFNFVPYDDIESLTD